MYKIKRFSKSKSDDAEKKSKSTPKDANAMTAIGKTGLGLAGVGAAAAGVELGRGGYHAAKVAGDIGELYKLKDDKLIRSHAKDFIKSNYIINRLGISDRIIDKARWAEKNMPEFSTLDRIQKGANWWNTASNQSRTVLNNAEHYAKMGVDNYIGKHKDKLSKGAIDRLNKLPTTVSNAAKAGTALKNAKLIAVPAAIAAQAGGLFYLNGRALQESSSKTNTSTKVS